MDDLDRYPHRDRDASRISRLRDGDDRAFGELYDDWYDRVFDLARRIVRDDEVAADVAQDTFLSAWRSIASLDDPNAFGGWLLRIARNRALNVGGREDRSVAVDDTTLHTIAATGVPVNAPSGFGVEDRLVRAEDPEAAAEDAELVSLLWDAADALGERDRTVLDLQLRHGLTPAEIGEVVGVNRNAANQLVHRVKGRLDSAVRARVLWAGDQAACTVLRAELAAAGLTGFDEQSVKLAGRHADGCDECRDRRQLRLQPAAMFGAVPIMVAPALFKQQAAATLTASGVPMQGSTAAGGLDAAGAASGDGAGKQVGDKDPVSKSTTDGEASLQSSEGAPVDVARASKAQSLQTPVPKDDVAKVALAMGPVEGDDEKVVDGDDGSGATAAHAERSGTERKRLVAAALVLVLLLLVGGVAVVMAGDTDDESELATAASAPPSTALAAGDTGGNPSALAPPTPPAADRAEPRGHPDELTAGSTTTTTTIVVSTTGQPQIIVIPPGSPTPTTAPGNPGTPTTVAPTPTPSTTAPPTTTTTTPVTASLTLSPASAMPTYLISSGPVLTWSTSGGASVEVEGNNLTSTARDGSARVCPGIVAPPSCSSIPGTYTYVVRVLDGDGDIVKQRSVVLTIA